VWGTGGLCHGNRTEKRRKIFIQAKCARENQARKLFLGGELDRIKLLLAVLFCLLTAGAEGNYCKPSHSVAHTQSVGLLSTSNRPVAETST
jgi:hypothetical protein